MDTPRFQAISALPGPEASPRPPGEMTGKDRLSQLEGDSDSLTHLREQVEKIAEFQKRLNAQNRPELEALPDFPQKFEELQEKILLELFESEKESILRWHKLTQSKKESLSEKTPEKYIGRKSRLMTMATKIFEEFPDFISHGVLMEKISRYLFLFNGFFREHADIAGDGKFALKGMETSMPVLRSEMAVLEYEKNRNKQLKAQAEIQKYEEKLYEEFMEELREREQESELKIRAIALSQYEKSTDEWIGEIELLHKKVTAEIAALLEEKDEKNIHQSTARMEILQHKRTMYEHLMSEIRLSSDKNENGNENKAAGTLALEIIGKIEKKLKEKMKILEQRKNDAKKTMQELRERKFGKVEMEGKQYIIVKLPKLKRRNLETFGRRMEYKIRTKLQGAQVHLVNGLFPESSYIAIELKEKIGIDPDDTAEYQQVAWIIEEALRDLRDDTGVKKWTIKSRENGGEKNEQQREIYEIGQMADTDIGNMVMEIEDIEENRYMASEKLDTLLIWHLSQVRLYTDPEEAGSYEIRMPRKMVRKRIRKAADVFMTILERTRSKSRIGQTGQRQQGIREISIPDELAQRRRTYNRSLRGIIEWSAKMAANEQDENRKYALYKKALENLYNVAPSLKGEDMEACYRRISDIEKILAEMAVRRDDHQVFSYHAAKLAEALTKIGKPYDENHPHFLALREAATQEAQKPPKTFRGKCRLEWKEIKGAVRKEWDEFRSEMAEDFKTGE